MTNFRMFDKVTADSQHRFHKLLLARNIFATICLGICKSLYPLLARLNVAGRVSS